MRLAIRVLALALLSTVVLAAPAAAELAPRIGSPPYGSLAGPVFAGDFVVWGRPVNGAYKIVAHQGPLEITTTVQVPGLTARNIRASQLEASDRRVVLGLATDDFNAVLTGPVGDDLTRLAGSEACPATGAVDVSGDVVAYDDCNGMHVRDLAPGASPSGRDYPDRSSPRVAGDYVATGSAGGTTVSNWTTGDDVYAISDARDYDVQADGKLGFVQGGADVAWASPLEPFPHDLVDYVSVAGLRMAADHVASSWYDPPESAFDSGFLFDVLDVNDPPDPADYFARFGDEQALGNMDFDGQHLLWADRACRHAWLIVADPDTRATSGDAPERCPFPKAVPGSGRFDAERHLRVRLRCDTPPGPACVGWVRRIGRHGKPLTFLSYSIARHHAKTVHFPANGSLCRVAQGRARAELLLQRRRPAFSEPSDAERALTVTARGSTAGLPRC